MVMRGKTASIESLAVDDSIALLSYFHIAGVELRTGHVAPSKLP
jgi:hypothetical protein